jgi:hypothetical protein
LQPRYVLTASGGVRQPKRITDPQGLLANWRGMAIAPERMLSRIEAHRDIATQRGKRVASSEWKVGS